MRGIRFVAALALIGANALFAAEPSGDPVPSGDKKAQADCVSQPPYVIQRPYVIEPPDVISIEPSRQVKDPAVSVQLARVSGAESVMGQYLVGPDGTINLRQYGIVNIAGKTAAEARVAVQDHIKQFLDSPELSVNVVAYNSKVYYVITQEAGKGDNVRRVPITGIVTVFDAISQEIKLSPVSNKQIWIARPMPRSPTHPQISQILPIDWVAITQGAEMTTNYQILPGDRLYITDGQKEGQTVSREPETIENFQGTMATSDSTIRGQTMGRNYNLSRNGL